MKLASRTGRMDFTIRPARAVSSPVDKVGGKVRLYGARYVSRDGRSSRSCRRSRDFARPRSHTSASTAASLATIEPAQTSRVIDLDRREQVDRSAWRRIFARMDMVAATGKSLGVVRRLRKCRRRSETRAIEGRSTPARWQPLDRAESVGPNLHLNKTDSVACSSRKRRSPAATIALQAKSRHRRHRRIAGRVAACWSSTTLMRAPCYER